MLAIVVIILVLACVAFAFAARTAGRRTPVPAEAAPVEAAPVEPEPEPVAVAEVAEPVASEPPPEPEPAITWTAEFTPATLDEAARLQLIDDLVLLGDTWADALLHRARDEERSPQLLARIDEALNGNFAPVPSPSSPTSPAASSAS